MTEELTDYAMGRSFRQKKKVQSTHWTNYCNGLYSAATYMQLCQPSIYFLVVGKCVYRESGTIYRWSNHFRGARVISPAQDTRVAGVSIFFFNSVSRLEAVLWPGARDWRQSQSTRQCSIKARTCDSDIVRFRDIRSLWR